MCIGDLVLTTPLLRVLKNNYPQSHISILVNKNYQEILKGNPNLAEIIPLDKKGEHRSFSGMKKLIGQIREKKLDLIINLTSSGRNILITFLSGAKKKVSYSFFLKKHSDQGHKVETHLNLLKPLQLDTYQHQGLEVYPDQQAEGFAEKFLMENQLLSSDLIIGLNPGASWPNKKWPQENWAVLADRLAEDLGAKVIFFGGPEDQGLVEEILILMNTVPVIAAGKTNLMQLAALIKQCKLFITGDTGPMHIAVGVKTSIIALFGPSSEVIYGPYGQGYTSIYQDLACRPCNENKLCSKHDCMKLLSTDTVISKVNNYL